MYAKIWLLAVRKLKQICFRLLRSKRDVLYTLVIGHKIKVYSCQYIVQGLKVIPKVSSQIYKKITYLRHAIAAKAITLPESVADI